MKCIIPCAGESSRMHHIPKHLVQIGNKPLLSHVVDMWKDHVDAFVFVLKRSATYLWEYLPENSIVVFQDEPLGLADAVMRAEKCVNGKFVINLGDCLCDGVFEDRDLSRGMGIGVWRTDDLKELNKSYLVTLRQGLVSQVIEKPNLTPTAVSVSRYCGMGTYFFDTRIFDYIRRAKVLPGGGDFTHIIQSMIDAGEKIAPVWFEGKYINVTHPEDIVLAEEMLKHELRTR